MSKVQFSILCPNGRKVTIKTELKKPLLLLIEEACLKQGYTPENYDLKHLRRILDPTAMVRYANIPNNAQLELVEAAIPRQASTVSVTLAISSGRRLVNDFSSNATLWEILLHNESELSPEEGLSSSDGYEPSIVYTIQKISGEKLKSTTLKSLGLISGKCMLRYSKHKIRTGAPSQPHVSSIMNPRKHITDEEADTDVKFPEVKPPRSSTSSQPSNAAQVVLSSLIGSNHSAKSSMSNAAAQITRQENPKEEVHDDDEMVVEEDEDTSMESSDIEVNNGENTQLISLCDGDVYLFSESDIPSTKFFKEEDSFFEISLDEAKRMYSDLVNTRKELEDAPLLTGRIRELEKNKEMLTTLHSYPMTHLRICFPDRYVIQASFRPHNTVGDVMNFLRQFLINPSIDFYLYTPFPRTKLKPENRLMEVGCTPKARVLFVSDTKDTSYLKEDVIARKSTFSAVSKAACKSKKRTQKS